MCFEVTKESPIAHAKNWRELGRNLLHANKTPKQRKKIERKRRSSEGVLLVVKMRVSPTMVLKKPPSNPKAFLFDIDGTLCDSDPVHFECFQELIMKFPSVRNPTRKPIDHDFFRKHIAGGSNPIIFNNLYPDLSEEERERMWTEKEKEYRRRAITSLRRLEWTFRVDEPNRCRENTKNSSHKRTERKRRYDAKSAAIRRLVQRVSRVRWRV